MLMSLWANPIIRKCILYGVALTAIFFAIRLYSNRVWSEGYRQGKTAGALEMEAQKRAEWEQREMDIEAMATEVQRQRSTVTVQATELARSRRELQATLSDSLSKIALTSKVNNETALAVPDSDLDAALRAISRELAASQP